MVTELGVADLKRRFSEVLARVELNGDQVLVVRRGRRVAVLAPLDSVAAAGAARPRRGLAAAVGAWEGFEDVDRFLLEVRAARDGATDRGVALEP